MPFELAAHKKFFFSQIEYKAPVAFLCKRTMKISATLIGSFVGGVVVGLVSMYFAYDKFFSSPNALSSDQFEANVEACKELQEWKDLEDKVDNLEGDLESETKKRKKASRERWGVVAGLGALGLAVALSFIYKKKKGGTLQGAKEFKWGFYD